MTPIHPNSRKSYEEEKARGNPATYRQRIIELLWDEDRPMTDREIRIALGVEEKSNTQPEITRLVKMGKLREYDKVKCEFTGKTVRRTKISTYSDMPLFEDKEKMDRDLKTLLIDWFEVNFKRTISQAEEDAEDLVSMIESESYEIVDKHKGNRRK